MSYEGRKYLVPSSLLASQTRKVGGKVRRKKLNHRPNLTYLELRERQQTQAATGTSKQTIANRMTALAHFMRANHLQVEDPVGAELRAYYPKAIEQLKVNLKGQGKSDRAISNICSSIARFKEAVVEYDTDVALATHAQPPFTRLIRTVMKDLSARKVAREAGVSPYLLYGWLNGKWPRPGSAPSLRRLEVFFGLDRDSLQSLAGVRGGVREKPLMTEAPNNNYRASLGARSKDVYWFSTEDEGFRKQWRALLEYKTAALTELERSSNGRWSFCPANTRKETKKNWWRFLDGKEVSSAASGWARTASYLGYLSLHRDKGGQGIRSDDVKTLAWFAVPDFLDGYLQFMKNRSGGIHTGATHEFLALVKWLTQPKLGYLYQQPGFQKTLPVDYQNKAWHEMCARQYEQAGKLQRVYKSEIAVGRDPFCPIRHLIESEQPMEQMADMIERMRRDRPVGGGEFKEAVWSRNVFIIKLLLSNPLRLRNIACLKWFGPGRGPGEEETLYQRDDGSWWIYVPKRFLKNRSSGSEIRDYHAPVHASVWPDLERYLFKHRAVLMRCPTDYVILTSSLGPRSVTNAEQLIEHRPYYDVSRLVSDLTARYLWRTGGIGAHAFRHIVATSILKAPGGDIKTAALVLNDRETTVEKHYAGLRSADGSNRMAELLEKSFSRM